MQIAGARASTIGIGSGEEVEHRNESSQGGECWWEGDVASPVPTSLTHFQSCQQKTASRLRARVHPRRFDVSRRRQSRRLVGMNALVATVSPIATWSSGSIDRFPRTRTACRPCAGESSSARRLHATCQSTMKACDQLISRRRALNPAALVHAADMPLTSPPLDQAITSSTARASCC